MVSISDQNPEIIRQTDGQQSSVNTSTPVKNENKAGIFRVGLTSAQAQSEGLSSLFTKYNTDGDDEISQDEFDAYTKETSNEQQQDITSKSGKRKAIGGVYTVQAGDTLSKIANDFGITLVELYETNKTAIGKDINKINVGLKLKVNLSNVEHDENHEHEDNADIDGDNHHSHGCSKEHDAAIENFIKILNSAGIKVDSKKMDAIKEQMKALPKEKVDEFVQSLLGRYIDMSKADPTLFNGLDNLLEKAGMNIQDFKKADPLDRGHLLAKALNANLDIDLDKENLDSRYNKTLQRLKESGLTESEKKYFKNFDFNNLSDKDYEQIATAIVTQTYQATVITTIHQKLQGNENDSAKLFMHGFMESYLSDANLNNNLMIIVNSIGSMSEEDLKEITNTYLKYTKSGENTNADDETLALEFAMQYGDKESIETFLQNNQHLQEKVANIASYVAENTTDESRKAMLNDIVENSASIAQGNNSSQVKQSSTGTQGSSASVSSGLVSNPIQNQTQINYINNLKQASENFHSRNDNSVIPENLQSAFKTVNEYLEFKGSGMTMAEYQRVKSALKNKFISSMNDIIAFLVKTPELKPEIFVLFDTMDNNKSGELYLNGSEEVRAFMNKYNYMNNEKLLQYVERHPADVKDAPKTVQLMIKELQEEELKKES